MAPPLHGLESASPAGHEVENQDDQREHQQQVDERTRNVKAEAQYPQHQHHYKDCPEHFYSISSLAAPKT